MSMEPAESHVGVCSTTDRTRCRCVEYDRWPVCQLSWFDNGWVCPAMQRLHDRRVINAAYQVTGHDLQCISILLGPAGPAILRFAQHEPPGALLSLLEEQGRIITPSMAHTLCALARWRWMVVHMICTRRSTVSCLPRKGSELHSESF